MSRITFPGFGLEFELDRVAFSIGSLAINWYGIIICVSIFAAFLYFLKRAVKTENINSNYVYDITLISVIAAVIGARFFWVITNLDKYETFWQMINIREGGIAIYGAIIFGGIAVFVYSKIRKMNILSAFDAISPAVMLGQIIGRWGNFFNGEAYGWSAGVEKLPWRMTVERMANNGEYINFVHIDGVHSPDITYVHPTFLYESLWNLIGFVLINIFYKKKKFDGQIFLMYIGWYGLGRAFIEMLRTDSLRIFGNAKLSVVIGFLSVAAAVVFYFLLQKRAEKTAQAALTIESKYKAVEADIIEEEPVESTEAEEEQKAEADYFEEEAEEIIEEEIIEEEKE